MRRHDIIGKRFGALVVIEDEFEKYFSKSGRSFNYRVKVRCDCGTEKYVGKHSLRILQSCGCLKRELLKQSMTSHGLSNTRLYASWCAHKHRGLMCKRWQSFETFLSDTGAHAEQLVERIHKNKNLSPSNHLVKDAIGRLITIDGETKNLTGWSKVLGVTKERARQLANNGSLRDRVIHAL